MQQENNEFSKKSLIDKILKFDYKDLENEYLGFDYHKETIEENTKPKKIKNKKRLGVFIEDDYFETKTEAAKFLGVNVHTFIDWANGRRNSEMKKKLKIKKGYNESED